MVFSRTSIYLLGIIFVTYFPLTAYAQETNQSVGDLSKCNSLMGRGDNNSVNLDCSETTIINNHYFQVEATSDVSSETSSNLQKPVSVTSQDGLLRISKPSLRTTSMLKGRTSLSVEQPAERTTSILEGQTTLSID